MKNGELEVNNRLPNGWIYTFPEEIGSVFTGRTPSKSNNEFYGDKFPLYKPTDLNGDNYNLKIASDYLSNKGLKNSRFIPKNSILVTCIASIGKIGFSRLNGSCNQQINAIVPCKKYIYSEYIYFYTLSEEYQEVLKSTASATTVPILNKSKFNKIPIKLPPLSEQKRIVAKIEKLFSNLDNSDKYLLHLEKQLKRYRQSVLKSAFEGELTKEWRQENKIKKSIYFKFISEIANTTSGGTPSRTKKEYWNGNINWLKSGELRDNYIELVEEKISDEGLKKSSAKIFPSGTLLMAMYGATVGRLGILNVDTSTNQAVCAIKNTYNAFITRYLFFYLMSIRQKMIEESFGGAQPNLSQGYINNIKVPICSILEQKEIVNQIEKHFSIIDKLENVVQKSINESKRLRKSILKQAFEGKLVEQDPNDESASILLEKIAKTKEEYQKAQKKQARKK